MSSKERRFTRIQADTLEARLREPRRFMQVIGGPRQVGKTTLVGQVLDRLDAPAVHVSADDPAAEDPAWLTAQWEGGAWPRRRTRGRCSSSTKSRRSRAGRRS